LIRSSINGKANTEAAEYTRWTDDFVAKLASDPDKKPDVVVVTGFCGTAPEGKAVRVFLNAESS
jgi:dienelactone hydrolase